MAEKRKTTNYEKVVLIALMCMPILTISLNYDNDFWFLLNHGKYVIENGFPLTEPFTIHSNLQFLVQQWLFDVVIYCLHDIFGKAGVLAMVYACSIASLILIYKMCMLLSGKEFILSALLSTVCYLTLCIWYMVSRPQIFTYIFLLLEIYVLECYAMDGKWQRLIVLPLLSVLLINTHCAMWWLSFAFIAPYIFESAWRRKSHQNLKWCPLCLTTATMLAAGFINPYGARALGYVFGAFGDSAISSSIMEMSAPDIKSLNGACFYGLLLLVVICYIGNRSGQTRLRYVLLSLGTTVMALMAIKSIAYFAIGTLIPLAFYLKNIAHKLVVSSGKKQIKTKITGLFLLGIIVASGWVIVDSYDQRKDYPPAKEALEYLKENVDSSQVILYTGFYDGGYAEYLGFRTYIDPRAEVFVKLNNKQKDIFQEYLLLQDGQLHYREFLARYDFTHILTSEDDIMGIYLSQDDNYIVYYEDQNSKIFTLRTD